MDVLIVLGTTSGFLYSIISIADACVSGGSAGQGEGGEAGVGGGAGQEPSHFFETSAMLISFVLFGRVLEAAAKGEASDAVASLLRLAPDHCCILVSAADGSLQRKVVLASVFASLLVYLSVYVCMYVHMHAYVWMWMYM